MMFCSKVELSELQINIHRLKEASPREIFKEGKVSVQIGFKHRER